MSIKESAKSIGYFVLGAGLFFGSIIVILIFIEGGVWVSEHILPLLYKIIFVVFLINLLIFGPISVGKRTIYTAFYGFNISSYVYGVTLWFFGLIVAYYLWGVGAIIIGLIIAGVGVVPIGMLAAIFNGEWSVFLWMVILAALTYGTRYISYKLAERIDDIETATYLNDVNNY